MSTYKIYLIADPNKSEYSFRLPDSKKHVDFKSMTFGSKFSDGKLICGTADPEIQDAIENLSKFKSGVIIIEREVEQDTSEISVDEKPKVDKPKSDPKPKVDKPKGIPPTPAGTSPEKNGELVDNGGGVKNEVIEEPTTVQEAKDWLKTTKGIAPIALSTFEKVKAQAEKGGVTFPNVVWPE